MTKIEISTERLRLRSVSLEEAEGIFARSDLPPAVAGSPNYPVGRTAQAAGRVCPGWQDPDGLGMYFTLRLSDAVCIGDLSFDVVDDQAWIALEIAAAEQGQGYGSEALRAAAQLALQQDSIKSVWLEILSTNLTSQAAAKAAGFEPTDQKSGQHWRWPTPKTP